MKNFEDWKADKDTIVANYDTKIHQLKLEMEALKTVRDAYAVSAYPPGIYKSGAGGPHVNWGAGMEDCGK